MAEAEGSGRKWLTCGCLGCAGIVLLILLVVGGTFGTAWMGARAERVTEHVLQPQVPTPPAG